MMPYHDDCRRDAGISDGGQNMFKKRFSSELQKGFGPAAHALGFSCGQYDCGDQWDNAYMKVFTAMR